MTTEQIEEMVSLWRSSSEEGKARIAEELAEQGVALTYTEQGTYYTIED